MCLFINVRFSAVMKGILLQDIFQFSVMNIFFIQTVCSEHHFVLEFKQMSSMNRPNCSIVICRARLFLFGWHGNG